MSQECPSEIKDRHRSRDAYVYIRQSTATQVEHNQGSTTWQRSQTDLAKAWGWPPARIHVVDDDLGLGGAAAEHRPGFQKILQAIVANTVGILILSDASRGSRDAEVWFTLLKLCEIHDVLVVLEGRVYDPKDPSDLFMSKLQGLLSEHDSRIRRGHLQRGLLAKIRAGHAVTPPPAGYVALPGGRWIKDPDPAVQAAIAAIFRIFFECRTLRSTVKKMLERGLTIPRQKTGHPVHWVAPTVPALQSTLKNEHYTGHYVWGLRRADPRHGRDARGHVRVRRVPRGKEENIPNHHEAYISRGDWETIQAILRDNRWDGRRGGIGRGTALLQGLLRCGRHRHLRMRTLYKRPQRSGKRSHAYHCHGDYLQGGPICGTRPGLPLDDLIVAAVLPRLEPPSVEALLEAVRRETIDRDAEARHQRAEQRRIAHEREDLWARYLRVPLDHPRLRTELEKRIEDTESRLVRIGTSEPSVAREDGDDEQVLTELLAIGRDVATLWTASTTTDRDRKEILGGLVDRIVLDSFDREGVDLTIWWRDRSPEIRVLNRPGFHRDSVS